MKRSGLGLIIVGLALLVGSKADAVSTSSDIRFALEREGVALPIVYYFSKPDTFESSYPILVLCDGSDMKEDITSVLYIRNWFFEKVRSLHVGYLTVEKWGVNGDQVDEEEFWSHYTRSQRLEDHIRVIQELEAHPPEGWNGQFAFVGVSEGGSLVADLSVICSRVLATVNFVGVGDWGWKEEFWRFFEKWKQESLWFRLYDAIPRWVPFSLDIPQSRQEYDLLVEQIIHYPTANLWMGGMTYLYHADALQKRSLDYSKIHAPFLVIAGSNDSFTESSDQFVQKAREAGAPVTYFRIDGMDHYVRKRPDVIDRSFAWLQSQIDQDGPKVQTLSAQISEDIGK